MGGHETQRRSATRVTDHQSVTDERSGASGLRRDLALLEALAGDEARARGGLGVVRLAQLLGREKSQVSRAMRALEQSGLVERDPETREYRLGWLLFGLAARAAEPRLLQLAPPAMRELVAAVGESVHLCVLQGSQVLTLLTEAPQHAFRASGWAGRSFPAYCSSAGRALLLDHDRGELEHRFRGETFSARGPMHLVRSLHDLEGQLQLVRKTGYAIVREEFEAELVGVSAPVRDFRGRVVAALNISAPKFRLGRRLAGAGRIAAATAEALSRRLGLQDS